MNDNDWISVEDKMPEEGQDVLAYGEKSLIWSGTHLGIYQVEFSWDADDYYWIGDGNRTLKNVTHWQPLPNPPHKETE